jgi:hypothetical protein
MVAAHITLAMGKPGNVGRQWGMNIHAYGRLPTRVRWDLAASRVRGGLCQPYVCTA